jgi:hypothetical protein
MEINATGCMFCEALTTFFYQIFFERPNPAGTQPQKAIFLFLQRNSLMFFCCCTFLDDEH